MKMPSTIKNVTVVIVINLNSQEINMSDPKKPGQQGGNNFDKNGQHKQQPGQKQGRFEQGGTNRPGQNPNHPKHGQ